MKEQVRRMVKSLPADATWNDVMEGLYVEAQGGAGSKLAEQRPNAPARSSVDGKRASAQARKVLAASSRRV